MSALSVPPAFAGAYRNLKRDLAPVVVPRSGTSLHHQLFIVLRDRITRGDDAPGAALPKEETLCENFGVSRITVRRALADLERLGFVVRRHGKGTFVLPREHALPPAPTLGLLDELRHTALDTQVEVIDVRTELPPLPVRVQLQLAPEDKAVHAVRLRLLDGVPVMLTQAWVPAPLGKRVNRTSLAKRALYEILLDQGVRFGRVIQEVSAVAADPTQAALLQTQISAPLIRLTRLLHDTDSQPVQHLVAFMSPERSRLLMDISGDAINTLSGGHIVHNAQRPASK